MRRISEAIRSVALAGLAAFAPSVATAADLTIAMPNWSSGQATAHILKWSIRERFGLDAEVRELGTLTAFAGLDTGQVDIFPEAWRPNLDGLIRKYEAEKGSVVVSLNGVPAWQGLCATTEAARDVGITDVADLSDKAKTAQLDTDGDGRGELWIGAPNWSSTPVERVRANSYGYARNLALVEIEEEVAMAGVDAAVAVGRPMVFACRAPHHVFKLHEVVRLKEPDHDKAKWKLAPADDPLWVSKSSAPVAWGVSHYHIAYSAAFAEEHPKVAAFLEKVNLRPAEIIEMTYALDVDRVPPDEYARQWVAEHADRVDEWVKP